MNKGLLLLGLTAGMLLVTAAVVPAAAVPAEGEELKIMTRSQNQPLDAARIENYIAQMVNQKRTEAGVNTITVNAELSANAAVRAVEVREKFTHRRLDGSTFATVISVPYSSYGENIAFYFQGPEPFSEEELAAWVVENWMSSSVHKNNLLDSRWNETGVGVYVVDNAIFVSQLYIVN